MNRRLICFERPNGSVGRHPIEEGVDPVPLLGRLAALVPPPAMWWVEIEQPRR